MWERSKEKKSQMSTIDILETSNDLTFCDVILELINLSAGKKNQGLFFFLHI